MNPNLFIDQLQIPNPHFGRFEQKQLERGATVRVGVVGGSDRSLGRPEMGEAYSGAERRGDERRIKLKGGRRWESGRVRSVEGRGLG